jgi:hypothetical protein
LEKPPTKKNSGMTCRNQVAIQSQEVNPMALAVPMTPWRQ